MAEKKEGGLSKFKEKRRKFGIIKALILIVALVLVAFFTKSIINIISLSNEKAEVEAKHEELTKEVEDLNQELENVNTDEYIEMLARRKLKLVKKKERLYILPSFESEDDEEKDDSQVQSHVEEGSDEVVDGEGEVEKDE